MSMGHSAPYSHITAVSHNTQVEIPLSLSHTKKGKDKKDQECLVWDFVVHPDTVEAAAKNPAIKNLLIDTVGGCCGVEHV